MNPRYPEVADRAGHRCEYCRAPEAIFNFSFEVEHIVPPNRGGTSEGENLALACRACNLHKRDFLVAIDPQTNDRVPVFHPRSEVWEEHFVFDAQSGAIEGRTSIGRGTVELLRMNSPVQRSARVQWQKLGLFP
jgi:hypothetical protein